MLTDVPISDRYVQIVLSDVCLRACRPKPCLKEDLKVKRLHFEAFCQTNPDIVERLCDTDESYVVMNDLKGAFVWRPVDDPSAHCPAVRFQHPLKLLVWGGISYRYGATPLHVLDVGETEDSFVYRQILQDTYIPWMSNVERSTGERPILRQDGATPHHSEFTKGWMLESGITFQGFPAKSPDRTPAIEMAWAIMKKILRTRPLSHSKLELRQNLLEAWDRATKPGMLLFYRSNFLCNLEKCLLDAGGNKYCDYIRKIYGSL